MSRILRDTFEFHLVYEDRSPFGMLVSRQLETRLKHMTRAIAAAIARDAAGAIKAGPALLERAGLGEDGPLFDDHHDVVEEIALPSPRDAVPAAIDVHVPGRSPTRITLQPVVTTDLAKWMSQWQVDARPPTTAPARALWDSFASLEGFEDGRAPEDLPGEICFVGHATVLVKVGGVRVLIDPFLLPRSQNFPQQYQPLTPADLAPDLILITHSHRDHFHIDSLLRLGRHTPIVVPAVDRETALSIDMAYRLEELGFTDVRALGWHDEIRLGGARIVALPWHGEQPTTGAVRNAALRNHGNGYLVEGDGRRLAFIADAGQDRDGNIRDTAVDCRARYGPIDVLFGGYRAFSLYPLQYVNSSVPQYLLFTPPSLLGSRQQIMNDAHALLDTAEHWHARYVVPYADGGAPWYWTLGLGPCLDGGEQSFSSYFDPRPQAVLEAAVARSENGSSQVASPVTTIVMRPGESLTFALDGTARLCAHENAKWPYSSTSARSTAAGLLDEPIGLSRKRVLLRILAMDEMARRGLRVTQEQIVGMSDELRHGNGLEDPCAMAAWLAYVGLSASEYLQILTEWQCVIRLEDVMSDEIERRVAGQRAFASMRKAGHGR